ncbi:MAG: SMEK domain-containing protein [Balneolaceae bacterium]|nr:SMEK domain-containing protein [Balneolaceae bacterium]
MNRIDHLNRINVLLQRFQGEVQGHTAMGFTDINKAAEDVLLPIFKIIYDLPNLRNLNVEKANHPAVDLGDKTNRIAFQITGTTTAGKIESTFNTFFAHKLEEQYDTVIFFFLTPKLSSYPKKKFQKLVEGRIEFNQTEHIRDFNDLRDLISSLSTEDIIRVRERLEIEVGESKKRYQINYEKLQRNELLFPNLLGLEFPQSLFVADINYDRQEVIKSSWDTDQRIRMRSSERNVAKSALAQDSLAFSADWIVHNKQIITFHDLSDKNIPLVRICDEGTITELSPGEFYRVSKDLENVFKNLLWRCLQQMLYKNGISYQHQVGLFIFLPDNEGDEERKVEWLHKKSNERTVFKKVMRKKDPERLDAYTHFAFNTNFELLDEKWFLQIHPDWFFSFDGYNKSANSADKVKYKKKKESNKAVYDHFNFLSYFLRNIHESQGNLFNQEKIENEKYFLKFSKVDHLKKTPSIDDKSWLTKEPKERQNVFENDQVEILL